MPGSDLSSRELWAIQLVSRRGIPVVSVCDVQSVLNCLWGSMSERLVSLFFNIIVLGEIKIATSAFFVKKLIFFLCLSANYLQ